MQIAVMQTAVMHMAVAVVRAALHADFGFARNASVRRSPTVEDLREWFFGEPIRIAAILVTGFVVNWLVRRTIRKVLSKLPDGNASDDRSAARSVTIGGVLTSTATVVIATVTTMLVLSRLGIDLAPLIASAGVAGVALGFGAQSLVRDVLAGLFVLIEDQYSVGDVVDVGPASGKVERISLRATVLRDEAGVVWHVPNGEIRRAGNKSQRWSRAVIDVTVENDADLDHVISVLTDVTARFAVEPEWADKLVGTPSVLGVQSLVQGGATVRVVCDTEPASQWQVERQLRFVIKSAFDREGIKLASPLVVSSGTSNRNDSDRR